MIDNRFFKGFEQFAQPYIGFVSGEGETEKQLRIWVGYFDALMYGMLDQFPHEKGILYTFFHQEGWEDDEVWEIPNLHFEIDQFRKFSIDNVSKDVRTDYVNILPKISKLTQAITAFLEAAHQNNQKVIIRRDY